MHLRRALIALSLPMLLLTPALPGVTATHEGLHISEYSTVAQKCTPGLLGGTRCMMSDIMCGNPTAYTADRCLDHGICVYADDPACPWARTNRCAHRPDPSVPGGDVLFNCVFEEWVGVILEGWSDPLVMPVEVQICWNHLYRAEWLDTYWSVDWESGSYSGCALPISPMMGSSEIRVQVTTVNPADFPNGLTVPELMVCPSYTVTATNHVDQVTVQVYGDCSTLEAY